LWRSPYILRFALPSRPRSQVQIFSSALRVAIIKLRKSFKHNA
jgi:hypothetical protein